MSIFLGQRRAISLGFATCLQCSRIQDSLAVDNVQSLSPYVPGKPIEELQRELGLTDIIKLASK